MSFNRVLLNEIGLFQINSVEESNKTKVVLQPRQETALKEIISEM